MHYERNGIVNTPWSPLTHHNVYYVHTGACMNTLSNCIGMQGMYSCPDNAQLIECLLKCKTISQTRVSVYRERESCFTWERVDKCDIQRIAIAKPQRNLQNMPFKYSPTTFSLCMSKMCL